MIIIRTERLLFNIRKRAHSSNINIPTSFIVISYKQEDLLLFFVFGKVRMIKNEDLKCIKKKQEKFLFTL